MDLCSKTENITQSQPVDNIQRTHLHKQIKATLDE